MKWMKITVAFATGVFLAGTMACQGSGNKGGEADKTSEEVVANAPSAADTTQVSGKFQLIRLPYATDALEPVISKQTMELHHGKHLKGYVTKLNELIAGKEFENMDLVEIVKKSDGILFNNAGQTLNHNLYFTQFKPNSGGKPQGDLLKAITRDFGSFEDFQQQFEKAGTSLFGSGWVWLASDKAGKLQITQEPNAGNPVTKDLVPLLGIDVWEHAYYLDYQNRRADHLKKVWSIIDWTVVGERYQGK